MPSVEEELTMLLRHDAEQLPINPRLLNDVKARSQRQAVRQRVRVVTATAAVLVAVAVAPALLGNERESVVLSDRYPNRSASEWITYGDFVAVVRVVEVRRAEPSSEAVGRGEGTIDRTVTFSVDEVIWRKADSRQPPAVIVYPALGWKFTGGDVEDAVKLVAHDRPRFESGHRYVVTFAWQPPRCDAGDGPTPGRWVGLGAGSALPFDGDVIGAGEFAGEVRDLEAAEDYAASLPAESVAAQVTGERLGVLADLLETATPEPKGDYGPTPSTC